jgi:hypothetical protein
LAAAELFDWSALAVGLVLGLELVVMSGANSVDGELIDGDAVGAVPVNGVRPDAPVVVGLVVVVAALAMLGAPRLPRHSIVPKNSKRTLCSFFMFLLLWLIGICCEPALLSNKANAWTMRIITAHIVIHRKGEMCF